MVQRGGSFRHRRVSTELRELRQKRGLSCRQVAEAIGVSESKISRMETGDRGLDADDVAAILGFLRAPIKQRQGLVALVRDGQARNWHAIHANMPNSWKDLISLEREATAIYCYEPLLIPGLAQTSDYARTLITSGHHEELSEEQVEALLAARMGRQLVLGRQNAPTLHLLIDEMVLRRQLGGTVVMYGQLQHLLALAARPNVVLQIVPFDAVPDVAVQGSITWLEFDDQPTLVYEESRGTSAFLEDAEPIKRSKLAWQRLLAGALSPDDSVRLIASIAGELA